MCSKRSCSGLVIKLLTEQTTISAVCWSQNKGGLNVGFHKVQFWGLNFLFYTLMIFVSLSLQFDLFADDTDLFFSGDNLKTFAKIIEK